MSFLSYRTPPKIEDKSAAALERKKVGDNVYTIGDNWLRQNAHGIWEAKLSGAPFEIGAKYGILAKDLIQQQEEYFVSEFSKAVPGKFKRFFLKHLVGWFNRKLDRHIPEEYLIEIYGSSLANSKAYNFIAPAYLRVLNYHAAHDIGHALNDYQLVGCTSFAVKGSKTADGNIISGRNFDFYSGDDFAKTKVIAFTEPENGHRFASYSWPGFSGVVSGMNVQGITVTMNAAKSVLPTSSKTPISLLGREILQYAGNIDEAIEIANKRQVFVSEALMINSASENRTVLIEKSPKASDVFDSEADITVCANHYQSELFAEAELNIENIKQSDSIYRYERMQKLLDGTDQVGPDEAAEILRDRFGVDGEVLGHGNPRAINQLIAHHSVIFEPAKLKMWISTAPWQIGEYICYDLNKVFAQNGVPTSDIDEQPETISADPFINSLEYENFIHFRETKKQINEFLAKRIELELSEEGVNKFINSNQDYYETYMMLGMFFLRKKQYSRAKSYFSESLNRPVASKEEEEKIKAFINKCK